jgi:hypothetical protein
MRLLNLSLSLNPFWVTQGEQRWKPGARPHWELLLGIGIEPGGCHASGYGKCLCKGESVYQHIVYIRKFEMGLGLLVISHVEYELQQFSEYMRLRNIYR